LFGPEHRNVRIIHSEIIKYFGNTVLEGAGKPAGKGLLGRLRLK
jgi:hypothetical protein